MAKTKRLRRKVRYNLVYVLIRSMIWVSNVIPRAAWLSFTGALGSIAFHFANQTRRLTKTHLSTAFPEKSESDISKLAKDTFRMLGKNAGDILRASQIDSLKRPRKNSDHPRIREL